MTQRATAGFFQRLLGRTILVVVLPTAIILSVLIAYSIQREFRMLRETAEDAIRNQAVIAADSINARNRDAVVSCQRMAEAQMAGMFGRREASITYARLVLENSPDFTASYIGYEPDADGLDAASLDALPAAAMDSTGRLLPYWFVSDDGGRRRIELEPMVDMETSVYYTGPKKTFEDTGELVAVVTEPYIYRGKMIVEQTFPIVIDGEFRGVAGVDRALRDVEDEIRRFATTLDDDMFLLSSRGRFIAATTDPDTSLEDQGAGMLKTKHIDDTSYRGLLRTVTGIGLDDVALVIGEDPTDGEVYYFAMAPIPTGSWTVAVRKPERAILGPAIAHMRYRIALAAIAMIAVFGLLIFTIVRVSRRINVAAEAASRVAEGDLSREIASDHANDETGSLLTSLRKMNDNLNELVGGVKKASIQINSTATELMATSRQQEQVSAGFGASATQIAASVKEISATGNELVQTMNGVSEGAVETARLADSGRTGLNGMADTMRGLEEATESIAEKLATINDRASSITGVVTTITKVAEQTNLLSVNAAIEAEKAGEYGVGFLVVAREIRRLADQSAAATLSIEQIVAQMQSAVSAGVMEMDRFADHVRRSVADVAEVSSHLAQIIERVDHATESFGTVSEGMQSQSQGAEQISEAMVQLTDGATQTAESIREYAQAADSLQGAIAALKSSIGSFNLRS